MEIVKVFFVNIELGAKHRHFLEENISDEQKKKALSFAHEIDQIRSLLSSYLKNQLSKESLLKKKFGKPYFSNGPFFNISHSGHYVVMATASSEIGIDIEENKQRDMSAILRIFNEVEAKMVKEHQDFYYLWCAKESLIKCLGSSINKIKEVPALPFNGVKHFKGQDYFCKTFIEDKHIISITRLSDEPFEIKIEKINQL